MKKIILTATLLSATIINAQELTSSDTLFSRQWGLKNIGQTIFLQDSDLSRKQMKGTIGLDINYVATDKLSSTKNELIVAVIDSGIDLNHPDLKDRIWYNSKLCLNAPNAKNLPCNGFNFLDNNNNLTDDVGHGTHVAGIIAANKNSIGIMGAADPRIKIMPLKVINNSVNGFVYNGKLITDVIADAMNFAIKNGAEVINLSLGWPKLVDTQKIRAAFKLAQDNNVMVIAASGNNNKDLPTFPCSYESVVCVGAHDNQGNLTDFTNHGTKVDITAPGEYIVSTFPQNLESRTLRIKSYEVKRGSSQAAPFVTAAIATAKLLFPNLKNDELKTALFDSSIKSEDSSKRFIKFGRLNLKGLLEAAANVVTQRPLVLPLTKELTEVKFRATDKTFNFNLPIKNFSAKEIFKQICIETNDVVTFEGNCQDLSLGAFETKIINLRGKLNTLEADSQIVFNIKVDQENFELPLFFTRDLNNDQDLKILKVANGNFDEMAAISSGRRISKMMKVNDRQNLAGFLEYAYLEKAKQTENQTVISLLTKQNENFIVLNLPLIKVSRLLSIHRQDINQDGELDYMIYALSNKKDELLLFFFDKNLNPLFKNQSMWRWPLTTFEGLPIDGGVERFDWIKIDSMFGKILVPSLTRVYEMPELDNSKVILDRIVSRINHQYFLEPKLNANDVQVQLRVVDSVTKMKEFRKQTKVLDNFQVEVVKSLPQSKRLFQTGTVRLLVRASDGETTKYFIMNASEGKFNTDELVTDLPLDGASVYSFFDTQTLANNEELIFSSLINRSRANYVLVDGANVSYGADLINAWENPVIGILGSFKVNQQRLFLMESRYTVSLVDFNARTLSELPIYRDSSFPGQNFSETLTPVVSETRPGVFVNSTLIFGERLYSMLAVDNSLVRPLKLSVTIPDRCIPLSPEMNQKTGNSEYVFLCQDSLQDISIKFLSM